MSCGSSVQKSTESLYTNGSTSNLIIPPVAKYIMHIYIINYMIYNIYIYQDMPKRVTTTSGNSDAKQAREPDCQSPLNQLCAVPAPKLQQTEAATTIHSESSKNSRVAASQTLKSEALCVAVASGLFFAGSSCDFHFKKLVLIIFLSKSLGFNLLCRSKRFKNCDASTKLGIYLNQQFWHVAVIKDVLHSKSAKRKP